MGGDVSGTSTKWDMYHACTTRSGWDGDMKHEIKEKPNLLI
jgi:hypothetical protein